MGLLQRCSNLMGRRMTLSQRCHIITHIMLNTSGPLTSSDLAPKLEAYFEICNICVHALRCSCLYGTISFINKEDKILSIMALLSGKPPHVQIFF